MGRKNPMVEPAPGAVNLGTSPSPDSTTASLLPPPAVSHAKPWAAWVHPRGPSHRSFAMRRTLLSLLIAVSVTGVALADDDISKVNGGVTVEDGQHAGDVHTVNGSVRVGANAVVQKASTVNGAVELGDAATAAVVKTVNGAVRLREKSRASEVEAVNGRVELSRG